MDYIKNINDTFVNISNVGGKGLSLSAMMRAGYAVPPAFFITSEAYARFIEENGLNTVIKQQVTKAIQGEMSTLKEVSNVIYTKILTSDMPSILIERVDEAYRKLDSELVAVRSSALVEDGIQSTWAGQLESYLNTPYEDLIYNIKKCWASYFTPRAMLYRKHKQNYGRDDGVAVIVQKMVQSEKSGVTFTVHPVTGNRKHLIIEAAQGLGESVVLGQVATDQYVVNKENFKVVSKTVSQQEKVLRRSLKGAGNEWVNLEPAIGSTQTLTEGEIVELSKKACGLEEEFGYPCDIEWAIQEKNIYFTQSRAITTL